MEKVNTCVIKWLKINFESVIGHNKCKFGREQIPELKK